jgi:cell division protein FtsB
MIRRRRQLRFPGASGAAGSDTDALQTDVMRFMSIIGLCLMAVFALVQSIPQPQPDKLAALQDLQQQLQQERQALADIKQDSMQKQKNLDELRGQLLATQQQLQKSRNVVAAIKREPYQPVVKPVIEKHPDPAPVAKSVIEMRPAPEPVVKSVIEKRPTPAPVVKPVVKKPLPAAVPDTKPLPDRQGYSLRFASAAALDRQVAAGRVSLYGMLDQQAWQLSMVAGTPVAATASYPKWFHEMSATTVPRHYQRSLNNLKNKAGDRGRSTVVWGVQLPATTSTAITSLLQGQQAQGQQGGALVIQSDGRVTLEP